MPDEHATKQDLRYVEGRLEGKIDGLHRTVEEGFQRMDEKYASKESAEALHKKTFFMNEKVNELKIFQGQVKVWGVVGAILASLLSGVVSSVTSYIIISQLR